MKKLAFLLLAGLLLAFAAGGCALTVSVKEASGALSKSEGDLFEFAAETAGSTGIVSFEWDFGDGSELAVSEGPAMAHNYYFEAASGEKKRQFTVKVKAKDSAGEASASIDINVEKSRLKARLKSPAQSQKLQKKSNARVEIEVLNLANAQINTASVSAKASIGGREITLAKEGTFFSGTISSDHSFSNFEPVEVSVQYGGQKAAQKLALFFYPSIISVKASPLEGKALYFGSAPGKIEAALQLPDGSIPSGGEFTASIVSGGKELEKKTLEKSQQVFSADFTYAMTAEDYAAGTVLKISGTDSAGNALAETLFPLELEKNNPLFNLKFESPGPGTESLKAGQKVQVSASFESSAGAQDAKIWVFLPETKEKEELSEQEGIFSGEITLPGSGQEKARLILYGTAKAGGAEVGDIEEAEFSLSSELIVSFVYPAAGAIQQQGDGKTLTVSVSLPNGDPPTKNSFRGSLDIDGKKQDVLLTRGAEKNQYALKLESALSGKHSLKLALSNVDGLKGYAEVSTEISQAFDWIGLLLLVLVVGALAYFANFIRLKFRAGAQGTAKAEVQPEKKDFLKEEKKRLEIEFYKRRISEEEFKERMLELQKGEKSRAIPREGKEINEIVIEPQKREGQAKPRIPLFFGRPKAAPKPEEDHARQVIEKRLESEDALSPLIIGRESDKAKTSAPQKPAQQGIVVEEFRPAAAKEAQAQKEPEFPKPKETLSAKKREDVREKIDMLARQGALQQKDEEAVNELVFALKPKAFAYTRNEIFESVIGEGFSERIAAEVVKRIFG